MIIDIAGSGHFDFSVEQVKQLDALAEAVEKALPKASADQQRRTQWAIAQMQLRLGRLRQSIESLQIPSSNENPWNRGYRLMAKAICLPNLGEAAAARKVFQESEAIITATSPEPLSEHDGLLYIGQLN